MFLPLVAVSVDVSRHRRGLTLAISVQYVVIVAGMLATLASGAHTFHEEIFFSVALAAFLLASRSAAPLPQIAAFAILAACMLSFKNTTFLLVLTCLGASLALTAGRLWRDGNRLKVLVVCYFGGLLLLAGLAALAWLWWERRGQLPTGNTQYRVEMYGIAWRRFLDSPLWGTGFTGSSVNYFTLYKTGLRTQNLPTHSDILDMLAHGGVFAIALWLLTLGRLARIMGDAYRVLTMPGWGADDTRWRRVWMLGVMQLCALVTYAVNPPLVSPVHAFWIWGSAGLMWALHRELTHVELIEARAVRPPILARRYAT
jgi:O-antigen ligase